MKLDDVDLAPEEVARTAGLVHVSREQPGWQRRRCGRGFTYLGPRGRVLRDGERARAEGLVIPPAWTDVWICADPDGHLQAAGLDDAGRWQYLYHEAFREESERIKYLRLGPFGAALEDLRAAVAEDLGADGHRRMVAGTVRLIDRTLMRIGGDEPEDDDGALGATTLAARCVRIEPGKGLVEIDYVGKGGAEHHVSVEDADLARVMDDGLDAGGERVFGTADRAVTPEQVNDYLHEVTGQPFTAKDFRTWGGTVTVAAHLAESAGADAPDERDVDAAELAAVDAAAERLGNTRAVARQSYLSPVVVEAHRDGRLQETWAKTRSGRWASRAERTVVRIHAVEEI